MTTTANDARSQHNGGGLDSALTVGFPFQGTGTGAELLVTSRVKLTGVETTMSVTTHYTVTGGDGADGTVTVVSGATNFPSTVQWTITRNSPLTQVTDYVESGPFPAATHEEGLDKLTRIAQEHADGRLRSLVVPVTDPDAIVTEIPSDIARANSYLGFDASGNPIALTAPTILTTTKVHSFGLLSAESTPQVTHDLGGYPRVMECWIVCADTDVGYAVSDRVAADGLGGLTFWASATQIGYELTTDGGYPKIVNKGDQGIDAITTSKWSVYMEAWR